MQPPQVAPTLPTTTDDQRPADTPPIGAVPRIILVVGRSTTDVGIVAVLASADGHLPLLFPENFLHPSQHIASIREYIDGGKPLVIATHSERITYWFRSVMFHGEMPRSAVEVLRVANDQTITRYTYNGLMELVPGRLDDPDWPDWFWRDETDPAEARAPSTPPKDLVIPPRAPVASTTR